MFFSESCMLKYLRFYC